MSLMSFTMRPMTSVYVYCRQHVLKSYSGFSLKLVTISTGKKNQGE